MGLQNKNTDASLQDILMGFWRQKWLILLFTLVGLILSLAYLREAKPVYEAKVFITPPMLSQIQALNVGRSYSKRAPLNPLPLTAVYEEFLIRLHSDEVRQQFYQDSYAPSLSQEQQKLPLGKQYENLWNAISLKKDIFSVPNGLE